MRATKYKHYGSESNLSLKSDKTKTTKKKPHKKFKAMSLIIAISLAAALILPTTTLAPNVDAFEDSKAASFSIGDIDAFSVIIKDNCVTETTVPLTQEPTTVAETTKATEAVKTTEAEKEKVEETKPVKTEKVVSEVSETETESIEISDDYDEYFDDSYTVSNYDSTYSSEGFLVDISNPDPSYSPKPVTLSSYDRAKLERLVMGEAGSLGYTGCALVAQAIRDSMNRSGTTSIDTIISEYKYYAPTNKTPNQSVKDAVSYIFDQNGSAVQHRILCFYTGNSGWHETQNFIVGYGNVRFFDLW